MTPSTINRRIFALSQKCNDSNGRSEQCLRSEVSNELLHIYQDMGVLETSFDKLKSVPFVKVVCLLFVAFLVSTLFWTTRDVTAAALTVSGIALLFLQVLGVNILGFESRDNNGLLSYLGMAVVLLVIPIAARAGVGLADPLLPLTLIADIFKSIFGSA